MVLLLNNDWVLDERLPNDLVADLRRYTEWGTLPKAMWGNDWYIMRDRTVSYLYYCHSVTLKKHIDTTTTEIATLYIYDIDRVLSWRKMWAEFADAADKAGD